MIIEVENPNKPVENKKEVLDRERVRRSNKQKWTEIDNEYGRLYRRTEEHVDNTIGDITIKDVIRTILNFYISDLIADSIKTKEAPICLRKHHECINKMLDSVEYMSEMNENNIDTNTFLCKVEAYINKIIP